ncbi:MAG: transposase [Microcystis aeruginosa S11-01]|nr:transposase [Microcystis aeruginosa S11-05]NCR50968.1 transposase [Microcystis aeruginosa S11-01]
MDKVSTPSLSIVIPTREGFADHWFNVLTEVKGEVEFILVHPPGAPKYPTSDPRVQQIVSPLQGEIIQRATGLMNATAPYTLTINCDEYINPDISEISRQYCSRFPDSWVMRLSRKDVEFGKKEILEAPWLSPKPIEKLEVCGRSQGNSKLYEQGNCLLEIPITPIDNKFDVMCIFRGRRDHRGPHTENFDKKVWKTSIVQETLKDLVGLMPFMGPFKYIPFWCLDRVLGLAIQAKFFEQGKGKIIGHLLPLPEQIRIENNPPEYIRFNRYGVLSELYLIRRFPQYGYMWNLVIPDILNVPRLFIRSRLGKEV